MRPSPEGQPSYPSQPFNGIALVGEAFGEEEARQGRPFVGASGQELTRMLSRAGIDRSACFLTNVFNYRPREDSNDLTHLCTSKLDAISAYDPDGLSTGVFRYPKSYNFPELSRTPSGGYLHPRHLPALARLHAELASVRPKVVLALGNTATWALLRTTSISKVRGVLSHGYYSPDLPIVATYHPAAILRNWPWRPTAIFDFSKARRVSEGSHVRPTRRIFVATEATDLRRFRETSLNNGKTEPVSIDIETSHGCITCLSLSPSSSFSLVVPFIDKSKPDYRYWPQDEEAAVWGEIQRILLSPIPKLFHNSTYDVMWLMHKYGLGINSEIEDTMILHHSMYLELQKSLRHLGSIYTDELAWKDMRGLDTAKRSDTE